MGNTATIRTNMDLTPAQGWELYQEMILNGEWHYEFGDGDPAMTLVTYNGDDYVFHAAGAEHGIITKVKPTF